MDKKRLRDLFFEQESDASMPLPLESDAGYGPFVSSDVKHALDDLNIAESSSDSCECEGLTKDILLAEAYSGFTAPTDGGIFKMEQLIEALPSEMTDEKKLQTVKNTLSVIGLFADDLANDAEIRRERIDKTRKAHLDELETLILGAENDIQHMKELIENAEETICKGKEKAAFVKGVTNAEDNRIQKLQLFLHKMMEME